MTQAAIRLERRRYIRNFKPVLRQVDTAIEAAEREVVRILARKRVPPEKEDLTRLTKLLGVIRSELAAAGNYLKRGYIN